MKNIVFFFFHRKKQRFCRSTQFSLADAFCIIFTGKEFSTGKPNRACNSNLGNVVKERLCARRHVGNKYWRKGSKEAVLAH